MAIAFFDMDLTVLPVNSGVLWLKRELGAGHLSLWQALRAALFVRRYSRGTLALDASLERAFESLRGSSAHQLRERTRSFFETELRGSYRPGALQALAEHRRKGDRRVLLTSSSSYLSELVAEELGLDAVLCNELEVDACGSHTGRVVAGLCFGVGKVTRARAYAQRLGEALARCAFYSDSFTDLPMLQVVGTPVAVNPDRALRREAARRAWRIVDWGEPGRPVP